MDANGVEGLSREGARAEAGAAGMARAFTILEVLVSVAIIGVLLVLLLPAAQRTLGASRGFKCQMSQRSVAFDFAVYADDVLHPWRGGDETQGPPGSYSLVNFQDSQYQIDEFWAWGEDLEVVMPDASGNDPMRCPVVRGDLVLRRNASCVAGGVSPVQNISFGFNIRLHIREVVDGAGRPRAAAVRLDGGILSREGVPLFWDVDGTRAASLGVSSLFSGPSLDSPGVFANDRYWFPGLRHNGEANVAFVDGHVESSARPLQEGWNWSFVPGRR